MKHLMMTMLSRAAVVSPTFAQDPDHEAKPAPPADKALEATRVLEAESSVTSNHQLTVKGQRFPYRATAGTQPVWDKDGKPIASLSYVHADRFLLKHLG
jgi:carboxypeptidase C (cathepsin A)